MLKKILRVLFILSLSSFFTHLKASVTCVIEISSEEVAVQSIDNLAFLFFNFCDQNTQRSLALINKTSLKESFKNLKTLKTCSYCQKEFTKEDFLARKIKLLFCKDLVHENCLSEKREQSNYNCPLCQKLIYNPQTLNQIAERQLRRKEVTTVFCQACSTGVCLSVFLAICGIKDYKSLYAMIITPFIFYLYDNHPEESRQRKRKKIQEDYLKRKLAFLLPD